MEKFKEKKMENVDFSTKRKLLVKSKGILDGKKFYVKEIFAGAMVVLTLLPAFFGGCSKDMPQTSGQTSVPVPTPSASTSYIPTETPGETPTFSIAPEPSVTPTPTVTPIQMSEADEIVQDTKDICDQLYQFADGDFYTGFLGQYAKELSLLGKGILPKSFVNNPKKYKEFFLLSKMFLALKTPKAGNWGYEDMAAGPIFDKIVVVFGNEDDALLFDYFMSRGKIICTPDGYSTDQVNQAGQEFLDGMASIYFDKKPIEVSDNKQIDFYNTTPGCKSLLNYYGGCISSLLQEKVKDGTIKLVQESNHNLKSIIKATDDNEIEYNGNFRLDMAKFEVCSDTLDEEIDNKLAALAPFQYVLK